MTEEEKQKKMKNPWYRKGYESLAKNVRCKFLEEDMDSQEEAWQKALRGELKIRPNCILPEDEEVNKDG